MLSAANQNYFIAPDKIIKDHGGDTELAKVIRSIHDDSAGQLRCGFRYPEIYKFYSIKEIREIIEPSWAEWVY